MFELLSQVPTELLREYGPVGTIALFLLLDKMGYYRKKGSVTDDLAKLRADQKDVVRRFGPIETQIKDLHNWHAPDSDGQQTWKNKHMLEVLVKLTDVVENHTRVMDRMLPILERLEAKV